MDNQLPPPKKLFKNAQWQRCYESHLNALHQHSGSVNTVKVRQSILSSFFTKRKPGDQYTRQEVETWLDAPTKRGQIKPATRHHKLSCLKSFYTYAAKYDVPFRGGRRALQHSSPPTSGIDSPQPDLLPRAFSDEELRRFFQAIPATPAGKQRRAIFLMYFWTARRLSEIAPLQWGDIEYGFRFDDGSVGVLYHFRGKGRSRIRDSAELPWPAWLALLEYLEAAERLESDGHGNVLACSLTKEDFLFFSLRQNTRESVCLSTIAYWFKEILSAAGLSGLKIHSLRHSAARSRHKRGESIESIKELLRHSSYDMTLHYLQLMQQKSDKGALRLQEFADL